MWPVFVELSVVKARQRSTTVFRTDRGLDIRVLVEPILNYADGKMTTCTFSPAQQQIIDSEAPLIVVCAGPGSGKTEVLTHRAARILDNNPSIKILAVTFTKNAASEMQGRANALLNDTSGLFTTGTFHGTALEMLKPLHANKTILSDGGRRSLLNRALERASYMHIDFAIKIIEQYGSTGFVNPDHQPLVDAYEALLLQTNSIDLSLVMKECVDALKSGRISCLEIEHIFVDELQDCDRMQLNFIDLHIDNGTHAFVIGDDDQSLYAFRFALAKFAMDNYIGSSKRGQLFMLEDCYRCRPEILVPANRLIQVNQWRTPKVAKPTRGPGGVVALYSYPTPIDELHAVLARFKDNPAGCAILAARNKTLDLAEQCFRGQLHYERHESDDLFDTRHFAVLADMLMALESHIGPALQFLNRALISLDFIRVDRRPSLHGLSPFTLIQHALSNPEVAKNPGAPQLQQLDSQWRQLQTWTSNQNYRLVIDAMCQWLATVWTTDRDVKLFERLAKVLANFRRGNFPQRLRHRKSSEYDKNLAQLMTLHAAKGLQFQHVWIISLIEDHLPGKNCDLEDGRKLLFVGMTRAIETLTLSYHRTALRKPDDPDNGQGNKPQAIKKCQFLIETGLKPITIKSKSTPDQES